MRTELIELGCETSLFLAHRQICNFTVYSTRCHDPCYKVHNVSLYTHCALYHCLDAIFVVFLTAGANSIETKNSDIHGGSQTTDYKHLILDKWFLFV